MEISKMDIINAEIEYGAKGTSNMDITKNILNEWRDSQAIKDMYEAEMYSLVKNTAIDLKTRAYKDPESDRLIVNQDASNIKTKTAQYRKSVNQKFNFALSKPFVISCDNDKYKEEWENFLNNKMRDVIGRLGRTAINKGIGWLYPWIDDMGNLKILDMNPQTIYPAWADEAHTELDAIVRDYSIVSYTNQTANDVRKVEFWDKKIVEKYIDTSNGEGTGSLIVDTDDQYALDDELKERAIIQETHMHKANGEGISWDRVPFIFLKANDDELPLLNECKSDIDSYDMLKSKGIDSLLDDIDAILVIRGISAEMGELSQARKMIQASRIVSVDEQGDAEFKKVNADISALSQQLEIIRKDIQDNTDTVDLTTIQLGTNPSGKSMRAFYECLNEWANGFEKQFRVTMENLKYFFDKWLAWKGGLGTFESLQEIDIQFTLDRDMMIDEDDIIENLVKLQGELSQETRDELNPYIQDVEKEKKRRAEDKKAEQDERDLLLKQMKDNEQDENIDNEEDITENEENQ